MTISIGAGFSISAGINILALTATSAKTNINMARKGAMYCRKILIFKP
jgi:hypothetical protein